MRTVCIGHGMKMYNDLNQTRAWVQHVADKLAGRDLKVEAFFFPEFGCLSDVEQLVRGIPIGFGGQNMGPEESGAYTGEVSVRTLAQLGCTHVELGHSERRALFNETDEVVNQKVRLAVTHGLRPVICIGEDREDLDQARIFLKEQVSAVLNGLSPTEVSQVILAYEPRWAIGQSTSADPSYVQAAHETIRARVAELFGASAANQVCVVYGGSVDPASGPVILEQEDVDGLFIGRAALDPDVFVQFIDLGEGQ